MSSTGVRIRNVDSERLHNIIISDEQGFVQRMKPFNAESSARGLVSTGQGGGQQPNDAADIFTSAGKAINGAIGYVQETVEVAVGETIDFFRDNFVEPFSSYIKIINAGVSEVIDVFNGGDFPGQILKLQGDATNAVTINNANNAGNTTSNIILPGTAASMTLGIDQLTEFIFDPLKVINGFTGAWRLTSEDTPAGGGSLPTGTAVNDHIEWDGAAWNAQQTLEFGVAPTPHGTTGFLRFKNADIMLSTRNVGDDGELEFKVDSSDFFDLTDNSNGPVTLQLRAQDAVVADKIGTIIQFGTATGHLTLNSGTSIDTIVGGDTQIMVSPQATTGIEMFDFLDMSGNQVQDLTALVYDGFTGSGKSISRFATGINYDIENAAHTHTFRVLGNPPAEVMRIDNDQVLFSQDINFQGNLLLGTERGDPGTPAANTGVYYVKDAGTVSTPFFMGDDGVAIDLTSGTGANVTLSNLSSGLVSINTSLKSDSDGIDNLGQFAGGWWDEVWARAYNFADNKPVDATESGIGQDLGDYIWINQTEAASTISLRWDDVESYQFARTTGLTIRNPALALTIAGASNNMGLVNGDPSFIIGNNVGVSTKEFLFDGLTTGAGERIRLTGTGNGNTEFKFRTTQKTDVTEVAKIIFEGLDTDDDPATYGQIVVDTIETGAIGPSGLMTFQIFDDIGGENQTFMRLDGEIKEIKLFRTLNCNKVPVTNKGDETIFDETTTTVVDDTADFLLIYDASRAANDKIRKISPSDLGVGGGGGSIPHPDGEGLTDIIENTADDTKTLAYDLGSKVTGTRTTLVFPGSNNTVNFPNVSTANLALQNFDNAFSATQNFNNALGLVVANIALFDGNVTLGSNDNDNLAIEAKVTTDIIADGGNLDIGDSNEPWDEGHFDQIFIGDRIRSSSISEMGFFVKNETGTLGSEGSIQIPVTTSVSPSDANLNSLFGSMNGAMGLSGANAANPKLHVKSNGNWSHANLVNSN